MKQIHSLSYCGFEVFLEDQDAVIPLIEQSCEHRIDSLLLARRLIFLISFANNINLNNSFFTINLT